MCFTFDKADPVCPTLQATITDKIKRMVTKTLPLLLYILLQLLFFSLYTFCRLQAEELIGLCRINWTGIPLNNECTRVDAHLPYFVSIAGPDWPIIDPCMDLQTTVSFLLGRARECSTFVLNLSS